MMKTILLILAFTFGLVGCAETGVEDPATPAIEQPTDEPEPTDEATDEPAEPTDEPEPTEEGPTLFQPGDPITVTEGDEPWAEITISKVKERTKYEGEYSDDKPAKGNVFIELFVTYEALVDGVDYNPFDWQVFADGRAVDDYAFVLNGPEAMLESGTLPKGRIADGYIIYEVPAEGQVLFSYGNTFGDEAPVFEVELRKS